MCPTPELSPDALAGLGDAGAFGPYEIVDVIGSGGAGVVYRARHRASGQTVALKTVRTVKEVHLAHLRREIETLSRLRHSGIVRILDGGVSGRYPWYAMELIEGRPFSAVLGQDSDAASLATHTSIATEREPSGAPAPREPRSSVAPQHDLLSLLGIARQICTPLAYLHGEGIVHRDLKPGNVLLRGDGTPVLADFGLVWLGPGALGRESIEGSASFGGTSGYMAPEQIRGESPEPRTDLYAIGCLLYEIATGTPPFAGRTNQEILDRHLYLKPVPPSRLVAGIPEQLDRIILKLLEKRPRDRFGYAEDVAAALGELGAAVWKETRDPPARPRHHRAGLSGRGEVLDKLSVGLGDVVQKRGRLVLLGGPSGIGKTSVAKELSRAAFGKGFQVVACACAPARALESAPLGAIPGAPFEALKPFFRHVVDRCLTEGAGTTARLVGGARSVLRLCEPAFDDLPGASQAENLPALPADAGRRRLLETASDVLAACASDKPILLILDDLQWADELTLAFMRHVAGDLSEKAVLLLGTYRSEESAQVEDLLARSEILCLDLLGLDDEAVGQMVADMLAATARVPKVASFLARESAGNPFFVSEFIHAAIAEGVLIRDEKGTWHLEGDDQLGLEAVRLPRSLQGLVRRRLAGLAPDTSQFLGVMATVGREIDMEILLSIASQLSDVGDAPGAIRDLVEHEILEEETGGHLRFVHDKVREVTYEDIPASRRVDLHAAVARAMEGHASTVAAPAGQYDARLAYHFEEAGQIEKASDYLERAADHARASFSSSDAAHHYIRLLNLRPPSTTTALQRSRWEQRLGEAFVALGRPRESYEHLLEAAKILGAPMPSSKLRVALSLAGQVAVQILHRLLPRATIGRKRHHQETKEAARTYELLMPVTYYATGDVGRILYATIRNLNLAEEVGPCSELTLAYGNAHAVAGIAPMHRVALFYESRAQEMLPAENDFVKSWVLTMRSVYHLGVGDWEIARGMAVTVRDFAAQAKFQRRWEEATGILATIDFLTGRTEEAVARYREQCASASRGDPQTSVWGNAGLAQALVRCGDLEGGAAAATRAVDIVRQHGLGRPEQIFALGVYAQCLLRQDRPRDAVVVARDALRWVQQGAPMSFYCINAYACVAEVLVKMLQTANEPSGGHDRASGREARVALNELHKCSRVFPVAVPSYYRCRALAAEATNSRRLAKRMWLKSGERARRLGMTFDEAIATRKPNWSGLA